MVPNETGNLGHRLNGGEGSIPCSSAFCNNVEERTTYMMLITATSITADEAKSHGIECGLIDYATIFAAETNNSDTFDRCPLDPIWAVTLKPADDMVIPLFLCSLHFNALKISLHEGVGVDEDVFGEFSDN